MQLVQRLGDRAEVRAVLPSSLLRVGEYLGELACLLELCASGVERRSRRVLKVCSEAAS